MRIKQILFVAALAACTDGVVDPTGNWSTTTTWGAGDCGLTGSGSFAFTVSPDGAGGYLLSGADLEDGATGTFACDADHCDLSFHMMGASATMAANLTLDAGDQITGSGNVAFRFDDGTDCGQVFAVVGERQ